MVLVALLAAAHAVVAAHLHDHEVGIDGGEVVDHHVRDLVEPLLHRGEHRRQLGLPVAFDLVVRRLVDDVVGAVIELALRIAGGEAREHVPDVSRWDIGREHSSY